MTPFPLSLKFFSMRFLCPARSSNHLMYSCKILLLLFLLITAKGEPAFGASLPKISIQKIDPISVSLSKIKLRITIAIDNPLPLSFHMKIQKLDLLNEKGTRLVSLNQDTYYRVAPAKTSTIDVQCTLPTGEVLQSALSLLTQKSIRIQIHGNVHCLTLYLLGFRLAFQETVELNLSSLLK